MFSSLAYILGLWGFWQSVNICMSVGVRLPACSPVSPSGLQRGFYAKYAEQSESYLLQSSCRKTVFQCNSYADYNTWHSFTIKQHNASKHTFMVLPCTFKLLPSLWPHLYIGSHLYTDLLWVCNGFYLADWCDWWLVSRWHNSNLKNFKDLTQSCIPCRVRIHSHRLNH